MLRFSSPQGCNRRGVGVVVEIAVEAIGIVDRLVGGIENHVGEALCKVLELYARMGGGNGIPHTADAIRIEQRGGEKSGESEPSYESTRGREGASTESINKKVIAWFIGGDEVSIALENRLIQPISERPSVESTKPWHFSTRVIPFLLRSPIVCARYDRTIQLQHVCSR